MRFVLLTAFFAALLGAQSPRRPLVIVVHGRGHVADDSAAFRRQWKRDLDAAFADARLPALDDADVRLAWYADVLDPTAGTQCSTGADTLSGAQETLGFLSALVSLVPDTARELRGLMGDLLYVADKSRRCAAEDRIGRALADAAASRRPVIVVAYSLGSLVAYDYLGARRDTTQTVELITLGSPLAVPEVREIFGVEGALKTLPGVRRWENVYDDNDVFAGPLGGGLARDHVLSGTGADAHSIGHYLTDTTTARILAGALCRSGDGRYRQSC